MTLRTDLTTALRWPFAALFILAVIAAGCSGTPPANSANNAANTAQAEPAVFNDAGAALAEGSRLLDTGDTDRAINALNQAITLDPKLADAWFKLGIAYTLVEDRDQSVVDDRTEPEATPAKGGKPIEIKSNSQIAFEKAVEAYKEIIKNDDQNDSAFYNLGRAYNKLNEDQDAAKQLKKAVELKPDDTEYQTELGSILVKLAQYSEAIPPLKKALELDPDNSRAIELLEDAEAGKKRVDFVTVKKDEKRSDKASNSANANTEAADGDKPAPSASPAANPKPSPQKTKPSPAAKP